MTTDFELNYVEVRTVDGRVFREERDPSLSAGAGYDLKRVTWRPADLVMTMVTKWGEDLEVEVFGNDNQLARRRGRPVVYLDQNIWIQISKALNRPELVPQSEMAPTLQLVERARGKELILPISSAHWIETGSSYGRRRTQLATQMVALSRGWIMRNPLLVAASEMESLFRDLPAGNAPQVVSAFTLNHQDLFTEQPLRYVPRNPNLPPQSLRLIEILSGVNSTLAGLLEKERTEPEGVAAASRWASVHQEFGKLASNRRNSADLREFTLDAFLANLGRGLAEAARNSGLAASDLQAWRQTRADSDFALLPYLGMQRELIHLRLMNTADVWEPNDLVDILFLTCAAAYADYVVCENKTGDYLQRAGRHRPGGAMVMTSVDELMTALET